MWLVRVLSRRAPSEVTRRSPIVVAGVVASLAWSGRALGACPVDAPRVEVSVDGADASLVRSVKTELESELARGKLCTSISRGVDPIARIVVSVPEGDRATVRISDEVTHKTVEREVSVAGLPSDGRALPIAIAADELLRASWAEIALHPAPTDKAASDVPKVVREAVGQPPRPAPFSRPNEIGIDFSAAAYGGGQTELGGELFYRRDLVSWLALRISVVGREGLPSSAPDGSIHAHAVGGTLSFAAFPLRAGKFRLGPALGVEVGYLVFEGVPEAGASSKSHGSATVFGDLGATAALELSPICLSLSALARAPFRGADAVDGTHVVTGAKGAGFVGSFGAGVPF